jgi:hypothetical protein
MEGWSFIMRAIMRVFTPFAAVYFVMIIFIGAFFLMNLTLAIITTKFS